MPGSPISSSDAALPVAGVAEQQAELALLVLPPDEPVVGADYVGHVVRPPSRAAQAR